MFAFEKLEMQPMQLLWSSTMACSPFQSQPLGIGFFLVLGIQWEIQQILQSWSTSYYL